MDNNISQILAAATGYYKQGGAAADTDTHTHQQCSQLQTTAAQWLLMLINTVAMLYGELRSSSPVIYRSCINKGLANTC